MFEILFPPIKFQVFPNISVVTFDSLEFPKQSAVDSPAVVDALEDFEPARDSGLNKVLLGILGKT